MYYRLLCALPRQPEEVGPVSMGLDEVAALVTDELDPGGAQIARAMLAAKDLDCETTAWLEWFDELEALAREHRCPWLAGLADFERSLREAIAAQRGGPSPADPARHRSLLRGLEGADPLARELSLDNARLSELLTSAGDDFSRDAVLAYLAVALVLERWTHLDGDPKQLLEVSI